MYTGLSEVRESHKRNLMMFMRCTGFFPSIVLCLLILTLVSSPPEVQSMKVDETPSYWPTEGWQTSPPELQGMNAGILQALYEFIEEGDFPLESLLIVRNGFLVYEHYPTAFYDEDDIHILYSSTKSITSTLIGIALQHGYLASVNEAIVDIFADRTIANQDFRKQAVTVEHLLTMTPGFEWSDNSYIEMTSSGNWVQYVLDLPMIADPGSEWIYNSGASHLLSAIVNETSPIDTLTFAEMNLFNPLGISEYLWLVDGQGIPNGGSELYLTPRDMAKFGFLFLQNGIWAGEQILPLDWVSTASTAYTQVNIESGYGYQWWTSTALNAFEARGYAGQRIMVLPEQNLVLVFTANDPGMFVPVATILYDYIFAALGSSTSLLPIPPQVILVFGIIVSIPVIVGVFLIIRRRAALGSN